MGQNVEALIQRAVSTLFEPDYNRLKKGLGDKCKNRDDLANFFVSAYNDDSKKITYRNVLPGVYQKSRQI